MKKQVKTKLISILLIIFILADMFSPYSILLNKSYAADELPTTEKYLFLRRTTDILTGENNSNEEVRYFEVLFGLTGEYFPSVIDVELKYNTDYLAFIDNTYEELTGSEVTTKLKVKKYMEEALDVYSYEYGSGVTSIDPSTGKIIIKAAMQDPYSPTDPDLLEYVEGEGYEIPEGYNGFNPVMKMRFKILDDGDGDPSNDLTAETLTSDLLAFNSSDIEKTPTGISVAGTDVDGNDIELQSLDYVLYDGFKTAGEVKHISSVNLTTPPTKTEYVHGTTIDLTGGILTITYTDTTTATVEMDKALASGDLVLDKTEAKVTNTNGQTEDVEIKGIYNKRTDGTDNITFTIKVSDPIVDIGVTTPDKEDGYIHGDKIDFTGLSITPITKSGAKLATISPTSFVADENNILTYEDVNNENVKVTVNTDTTDVSEENINNGYFSVSDTTPEGYPIGTQKIVLTYYNPAIYDAVSSNSSISKEINILVHDTIGTIEVVGAQPSYVYGEELNKSVGTVNARTAGGHPLDPVSLDHPGVKIEGYVSKPEEGGSQELTVTYLGATTKFSVIVTNPISDEGLSISPLPDTSYEPGEELRLNNAFVYEVLMSGTPVNGVKLTTDMITGYNSTMPGVQTLTVTYKGKTTTFDVTVEDILTEIRVEGMITEYSYGDTLNLTGAKVIPIKYSGNKGIEVPLESSMIVGTTFNPLQVGEQTLTIQYEGIKTEVKVKVNDVVSAISMNKIPTQIRHYYGESLNVEGGEITVEWASGADDTQETMTDKMISSNGADFTKPTFPEGKTTTTKKVTVIYGGESTTYDVTIVNEVTGIVMKTLPKVEYNIKDTLDVEGGMITVTRQNGTTEDIPLTDSRVKVEGLDTTAGAMNQELKVTFTENDVSATTQYEVDVIDQVKTIKVVSQPSKKEYGWEEALDLTGAKIDVEYGSGIKTIDVTTDMITNYNSKQTGKQNLIVEYPIGSEIMSTVTIPITVVDKLVSIKMNDIITSEYKLNETINKNETFTLTRQSGATETKTIGDSGVEILNFKSDEEFTSTNKRRVTIKYTENYTESDVSAEDHYDIQVLDRISKIEVTTKPKVTYNYEELFSTTNGKVTVTKVSGNTEIIDLSTCNVTGYDPLDIGTQEITVTYEKYGDTKTCTYEVEVKDFLDYITVTPPTTVDYGYGMPINLTGGVVTKHMKSGAEIPIALDDAEVTIVNKDTITQQIGTNLPVTVKVGEKTATFTINVQDEIDSIELAEGTSIKTAYLYNENFDPNGAYYIIKSKANPDGSEVQITTSMVTGFDSTRLTEDEPTGTRELTITVAGQEFKYTYTVNNYVTGIELIAPTNTRYSYSKISDGTLDITGATVKKIMAYTDPDDEVIPIGLGATGVEYGILDTDGETLVKGKYDPDLLGTQTVYVNYAGFQKTFTVVVRDELVSIEVDTTNGDIDKKYIYGDSFNANGAQLKVNYLSKSVLIPITDTMLTNFYTSGDGALTNGNARTATISYSWADAGDPIKTATTTFTYEVEDEVKEVVLTPPTNRVYYYGLSSELDLSGGTVQKIMKSGIPQAIVDLEDIRTDITGYIARPAQLGDQTITVNYGGKQPQFTITVKDRLEGVAIVEGEEEIKSSYYWGDELDLNGAKLAIDRLKEDEEITITADMVEDFTTNALTADGETRTATIPFVEDGIAKEATFAYTVSDYIKEIATVKKPSNLTYYLDDTYDAFDYSDGYLVITMASSTPASDIPLTDSSRVKVTGFDTSSTGTKVINIELINEKGEKLTASYDIEVKDRLENVELVGTPDTSYQWGETIRLNGAQLKITKLSGVTYQTITAAMVQNFNTQQLTEEGKTITATIPYTFDKVTKSVGFNYTVSDYIKEVELIEPDDTEYFKGEELDLDGGELKITMASGTPVANIPLDSEEVEVTGYNKDSIKTQTITVKYEEFTKTFDVVVKDRLESIKINGEPITKYEWADDLDLNGADLEVTKLSGVTYEPITDGMISGFTSYQLTKEGEPRQVTITYSFEGVTKTATFDYTVADVIKGVTLKAPSDVEYEFGDDLALSDGYLVLTMASGNVVEDIPLTDPKVTITGYNKEQLGKQTITVEYAGYENTFGVLVVDQVKNVTFNVDSINADDYKYGASLDLSKATAEIEMKSGQKVPVDIDNSMISGYNPTTLGEQEITITVVEGFTKKIKVNVVDYVASIELTPPTKPLYIVKEELDLTGGSLKVTMASGEVIDNIPLTDPKVKVTGYDKTKVDSQIVYVTYEGFEGEPKQFPVVVVDQLAEISIESVPNKLTYQYGEELDLTGGKIKVTNKSDKFEIIEITEDMVTGYDPKQVGGQIITVTYKNEEGEEKTTTFPVIVEDYVNKIEFTKPEKTEYKWGEELDLTGAKFTEKLASGKVNKVVYVTPEMVTKFNNKVVGKQTLTATYGETKGVFEVSVVDEILSMAISNLPNKVEYNKGEVIDLTGGKITIIKDSGVYNLDITEDMISGFDPNVIGAQIITVKHEGFESQLSVVVKEVVVEEPEKPTPTRRPIRKPSSSVVEDVVGQDNITSEDETNANASENKDKENNNDVNKDVTLGVKDEDSQDSEEDKNEVIIKTITVAGLGIIALVALVFVVNRRNNVKIYEEDENELILVGKDRLDRENKVINISRYVQNAPDKNIVIVLNKNISKKLDKETIKIKLENEELETVVEYENGEFEIRVEK